MGCNLTFGVIIELVEESWRQFFPESLLWLLLNKGLFQSSDNGMKKFGSGMSNFGNNLWIWSWKFGRLSIRLWRKWSWMNLSRIDLSGLHLHLTSILVNLIEWNTIDTLMWYQSGKHYGGSMLLSSVAYRWEKGYINFKCSQPSSTLVLCVGILRNP